MSWMDVTSISGKILCPNTRCKTKLGNYDWSGQKCGCSEWLTPVRVSLSFFFELSEGKEGGGEERERVNAGKGARCR